MNWIIFAAIAPLMLVFFQMLSKLLPQGVSVFLVTAYSALSSAIVMFVAHFIFSSSKSISLTSKSAYLSIVIGVFLALANFFVIKAYSLGAPQASFSAIMYSLLIIYATFAGVLVWHEKVNAMQLLGILMSVAGIILVLYFKNNHTLLK
jgi:drug/metabolite transporter (DMT)-like permease